MKKCLKKLVCFCLCLAICMTTTGCTADEKKEKNVIEEEYINYWTTYSKKAKMTIAGNYISYIDPVSAKEKLICNDMNCLHKDAKTCGAVVDGVVFGAIHREGKKIYYIADADTEKIGECSLFEADLDGKNRKKIASLMNANTIMSAIYTEKYIYISYVKDSEEDEKSCAAIYAFDRKKKSGKVIYQIDKVSAQIGYMILSDGILYASTGYSDASAKEIKKHKKDIRFINKHFERNLMALRLKDSKVVHTIDSTGSGFFQIREHKVFYSSAKAVYCYDIYTKKNYKIANDDKILIFSDKKESNTLYFRDDKNYYRYDIRKKTWHIIAKADVFFVEAMIGDWVYGFISSSKAGQGSESGIIKRSDFEKGNITKMKKVKTELEMN